MNLNSKTVRMLLALVYCMAAVANARLGATEKSTPDPPSQLTEDNLGTTRELRNKWTAQQKNSWKGNNGDKCVNWQHQVVKGKMERCNKCKAGRGTLWKEGRQMTLKCGVQPRPPTRGPRCNGGYPRGTFVPASMKHRCCNGAQYASGGYRCK